VILVGHSYGGCVITQAGNDPKVVGLVYITHLRQTRRIGRHADSKSRAGRARPSDSPPQDGVLMLDRAKFAASFAADVQKDEAEFMANSQVPWGVRALEATIAAAAWRASRAGIWWPTDDRMIPPPAQRSMSKRAARRWSRQKAVMLSTSRSGGRRSAIERAARELESTRAGHTDPARDEDA